MTLPKLTVANLKRHATDRSISRAESYFRSGAVTGITLRQQTLSATVEGNQVGHYRVNITFDEGGILEARCSCPYEFGGWCKHIVATLMVCIHKPQTIESRPSLSQLLEQLNLSQTKELIQSLVEKSPDLLELVDFYASKMNQAVTISVQQKASPKRKTSVDPAPYQRQAREIVREAVRGWEYGAEEDDMAEDLSKLTQDALAFVEQGDGYSALSLLQGITEGCAQSWHMVDDFLGMEPIDFSIDLDSAWTEALLSTDLSADEASSWQEEIEIWQDSLGDFPMALEALRQGWDYPPLQRVFQGEITEQGAWVGEAPDWADEFSQIRLKILSRQKRYEDYLLLAQAEGQTQAYLTMLGQLGRIEEAMSVAKEQMETLLEAKALAETLRTQNRLPEALAIAMQGLRLAQDKTHLLFEFADWTRNLAEGLGDRPAELEATIAAFGARPSLRDYQAIEALAGENWANTREKLLQQIREMSPWLDADAQVDILLHEGLISDAVEKVSDFSSYQESLVLRVMDVAIASHSEWVIENALRRAEPIMNEGRSQYYSNAVEWLKRVKAAYIEQDKEQDWIDYRRQLIDAHQRKRKLMGLIEQNKL